MRYDGADSKLEKKAKRQPPQGQRTVMQNPYADELKGRKKASRPQKSPPPAKAIKEPMSREVKNNSGQSYDGREAHVKKTRARQRKRHKKNYILHYIILLIVLSATGITLSLTVFFNVGEIAVSGDVTIPAQEIKEATGVKMGDNMFRMSMSAVEKRISQKYITVDEVQVSRRFPATLKVEITMAKPKALLKYEGKTFTLSEKNRLVKENDGNTEGLPVFAGVDLKGVELGNSLEAVLTKERSDAKDKHDNKSFYKLSVIDSIMGAIDENEMTEITAVDITDIMAIKLYIDEQYEIKIGGTSNIAYKLHCAKSIIGEQLVDKTIKGVVDVSVDNGMYYFRPAEKIEVP